MIEGLYAIGIVLQLALLGLVWRSSMRHERTLIALQRSFLGLPPASNAKPPPADVLLRRAHTQAQEAEFDARLKLAHEEFQLRHKDQFEQALRAQKRRR